MKKTKTLFSVSTFLFIAVSILAGCDKKYSESDIAYIQINDSTFNTSTWIFHLDQTLDYSTLAVDLYDSNSKYLDTIYYADTQDSFEYTEIDTSEIGTGIFSVTYTSSIDDTFTAEKEYTVVESIGVEPDDWARNAQYNNYLTYVNNALDTNSSYLDSNGDIVLSRVSDTDLASSSLIKSDGKFYVANRNQVYLGPECYYYDGGLLITDLLPSTTSIAIYSQSDTEHENNLVNLYLDDDAYKTACTTGYVDFVDDLDGLETDITLVFSATGFDDQAIDLTVVDGWNITEAEQLILMDNAKFNNSSSHDNFPSNTIDNSIRMVDSYLEKKKEVLGTDEVTATTSFETFVLFNSITIEKDDLPSALLWAEGDIAYNSVLDGSLKDWYYVYEHNMGEEYGNATSEAFNFYGNYNSISLGETFPYILSERSDNYMASSNDEDVSPDRVDSHTALFGSNQNYYSEQVYYSVNFYDLVAIGNQGVDTDQYIDEDGKVAGGGVIFAKYKANTNFTNCTITSYFTVIFTPGEGGIVNLISDDYQITYNVNWCKFNNSYSQTIYMYGESNVNITNSLLSDCGGPLFILAAVPYGTTTYSGVLEDDIQGTNVTIDEATVLRNYVTGEGGWFDLITYASAAVSNIKLIGKLFNSYGKDFVTKRSSTDDTEVLNFIALGMCTYNSSAGALNPGMRSTLKIGDKYYLNYEDGKDEITEYIEALSGSDYSTALTNLLNALANTVYGTEFLYSILGSLNSSALGLPTFVTYNGDTPTLTTINEYMTSIVSTAYYVNQIISQLSLGNSLDATLATDAFEDSEYIGMYVELTNSIGREAITIDISNLLASLKDGYERYISRGSSAYGIVLELFDN